MHKLIGAALALGLVAATVSSPTSFALAAPSAPKIPLKNVSALAVPGGHITELSPSAPHIDPVLKTATGPVRVVIQFSDAPLTIFNGMGFKQLSRAGIQRTSAQAQRVYVNQLANAQQAFIAQATTLGATTLGQFTKSINGVAMQVDASRIDALAALPGVASVRGIVDYQLALTETVPYIGGTAVQATGITGKGIVVAVIDSGIDYTHANLGGPGTKAAYELAYGVGPTDTRNTITNSLFPSVKVMGGYDFVGESWPSGPEKPDPNPIDHEGHGTHVADIIAGVHGVAPGASLMAIKACSAVASSCSGLALLDAVEFALDPNQDGDLSDAADVINLSLGQDYGQSEDDLSYALGNAVRAGVVVVASAGNGADRPFKVSSPSSQPEVISVAQTNVPSAKTYPLKVDISGTITLISNTNTIPFAPITSGFSGLVAYVGRGCPGTAELPGATLPTADAYKADPSGKIALIDRGACAVSEKIDRVAKAGATAVLITNNVSGDPPTFSQGAGQTFVQTLVLALSDGNSLKEALFALNPIVVTLSTAAFVPLVGSMVASSSRGPSDSYAAIKPEIGAPGASVSAVAGSGTGVEPFGGTSGAAPMVSGAAALLLSAHPDYSPRDIKSLLVNTAETKILVNPATKPGVLAPITSIGGGEVRVDRAAKATTAAWAADDDNPALSFGYHPVTSDTSYKKRVIVRNFGNAERTYTIKPSFRYADDAASGAVTLTVPATITVAANGAQTFVAELAVNAAKLPVWPFSFGNTGDGPLLQQVEFDGYVTISDATDSVHLPWQILPHKSAAVSTSATQLSLTKTDQVTLTNASPVNAGDVDVFTLTGVSPPKSKDIIPNPGDNHYIVDLKATGFRPVQISAPGEVLAYGIQFAISTWDTRPTPLYPGGFNVFVDVNRDGKFDYVIYNSEAGGFGSTGQCIVNVLDLKTGTTTAYFYCDGNFQSGNIILTVPLSALGLTLDSEFSFEVDAYDNYFSGALNDAIYYMTSIVGSPKYYSDQDAVTVPAGNTQSLTVLKGNEWWSENFQVDGLLLIYRDAVPGHESQIVRVK